MAPDPLSRVYDQLLVVRAQAGDDGAFAELVARFSPRLRYFLRTLLGDHDAAEDELQNVWLDALRGLRSVADPAAFPAWAYRIARLRAARRFRRKEPPAEPLPDVAGPEPTFTAADAAAVHAALGELRPEFREVLALRFLDDLSYEAVAAVVGVPVGTVRSRLFHAKKALRAVLERENSDG